ncbi:PEP-CTERM sorting domain-containing protein [Nodularia sphaerocarpa]|uniref:PEP-CTERM sorting domain-containing protein n=1 Tax=Nodularia sphaerocarpa TaxID=137816 RepID=UPI001EFB03CD|nr:PEP-CTERM sorting domain-containing protein [Nodularia sphaerocarpa]MDB9373992.1 PEP-CTERM sorting domain-containing protein [Nodularia sphaerocarpa CS-585]MDB9378889.1 PEP-CTERM sorting domain-containing protein [Nodularia sphaerocarpa CS-585A2]ULP72464.1 hypothetical protein BDGGKGIB_02107 [Nodularia sphaerocarpa UHCC 0038]
MKTLNKIGIGAALAASTLAFSTVGMSSAQASVLGRFTITGTSALIEDGQRIRFSNARVEDTAPVVNSFTPLADTRAFLSSIDLTNPLVDGATTSYVGNVTNPFLTFAADSDLIFTANNPFQVSFTDLGNGLKAAFAPINGLFTNTEGDSIGRGVATIEFIELDGGFSLTLDATPIAVPEPTTTLGLAALGLGAFFSKSMAKKKKKLVNA